MANNLVTASVSTGLGKTATINPNPLINYNAGFSNMRAMQKRVLLEVGKAYLLTFNFGKKSYIPAQTAIGKFIKSTPKGYNFENLRTHKLFFKQHLYPSKIQNYENHQSQEEVNDVWVWLNGNITISLPIYDHEFSHENNPTEVKNPENNDGVEFPF